MILENPAALSLLALGIGIVLLYFLRTRRQRHEVSALFLWEGLPNDPRTRAARIRVRVDLLLLLQLLVLAALVAAVAQPAFRTQRPRLASLAIVLDGSASLRARTEEGRPSGELARAEALALLDRYSTTPVALFELSTSPRVLAPLSAEHDRARRALVGWEPTWFAGGTAEDLTGLLASQGGAFERVVLLTDHRPDFSLPGLDVVVFSPGENVAVTAFGVREEPGGNGSIAFLKVRNDTSSYRDLTIRVSDGSRRALLPVLLPPGEEQAYVLPFPASLGPVFSATVDGKDSFPADDARTFSLARRTEWRIRVIGRLDRYLRAALTSLGPVQFLEPDDPSEADVVVACNAPLLAGVREDALLVHTSLLGAVDLGEDEDGDAGSLTIDQPGDPLLADVDPLNFLAHRIPPVRLLASGTTVLSAGGEPILWRADLSERRVVLLAPDLLRTNLPLTVDFPLLIRNALHWLSLADPSAPPPDIAAGDPIPFASYGTPVRLKDPSGREMEIDPDAAGFLARAPGTYLLTTSSGTYPIAVNVAWEESPRRPAADALPPADEGTSTPALAAGLLPAWPIAAGLALALLILEGVLYQRPGIPRRTK